MSDLLQLDFLRHALTASLLSLIEPVLNPIWVRLVTAEMPGALT